MSETIKIVATISSLTLLGLGFFFFRKRKKPSEIITTQTPLEYSVIRTPSGAWIGGRKTRKK